MPRQVDPIKPGSLISAIVSIIESVAEGDTEPLPTRMAILDAVTAEIIWGLGSQFDVDVVITRHGENVADMINQMNDFDEPEDEADPKEIDTP